MLVKRHTEDGLFYLDRGDYVEIPADNKLYEEWVHHQWQNRKLKRWFYFRGKKFDIQ